jgi:hypothetical protein
VQVLLPQGNVQAVSVACGGNVRDRSTFAEHLQNGVAWHEMYEKKNNRDHQPENRQRVQQSGK